MLFLFPLVCNALDCLTPCTPHRCREVPPDIRRHLIPCAPEAPTAGDTATRGADPGSGAGPSTSRPRAPSAHLLPGPVPPPHVPAMPPAEPGAAAAAHRPAYTPYGTAPGYFPSALARRAFAVWYREAPPLLASADKCVGVGLRVPTSVCVPVQTYLDDRHVAHLACWTRMMLKGGPQYARAPLCNATAFVPIKQEHPTHALHFRTWPPACPRYRENYRLMLPPQPPAAAPPPAAPDPPRARPPAASPPAPPGLPYGVGDGGVSLELGESLSRYVERHAEERGAVWEARMALLGNRDALEVGADWGGGRASCVVACKRVCLVRPITLVMLDAGQCAFQCLQPFRG